MKKIGMMTSDENHEGFSRILKGKGLDFQEDSLDGGVEFWAIEEEDLPEAQRLLEEFRSNPDSNAWKEDLSRGRKAQAEAKKEDLQGKVRTGMFQVRHSGKGTKVSLFLIYISVALFVMTHLDVSLAVQIEYWAFFATGPDFGGLAQGQIWRVITPILLHFGPLHILFNSLWMLDLGRALEWRLGSPFFVRFVFIVGGLSNLVQYLLSGHRFGGLSGVVFGLLGYIWLRGRHDPSFILGISQGTMMMMMGWLLFGFLGILPIANGAHVGGLVVGTAMAYVELKKKGLR